ncbi:PEP-CTERM sorting domain-containing protein [Ideonella sp. A 288]|uniref:PEP-CTERM sorting domain-containing protein n=1 Tax=Ideonella sp. A 288 TaxID=1962181 RepID=UPI000B4ABAEE|nr:PEP-CTERM sorting domain-containing protein [Ideonella sp. A 288]
MKYVLAHGLRTAVLGGLLAVTGAANALTISFTTTNLADTTVGQDLWRYNYTLNGAVTQFDVMRLTFDDVLYGTLSNGQPATSTSLQVQPLVQPAAPTDGSFGLRVIGPTTTYNNRTGVSVDFVWKGVGTPGAQPFTLFNQAGTTLQTGTTAPVPEPGTYAMMAVGLLLLAARRYRKRADPVHQAV